MIKEKFSQLFSFQNVLITVLVAIILFQRCGGDKPVVPQPKIDTVRVVDTQYIPKTDTIYGKPKPSAPPVIDTTWRDSLKLKDSSYAYLFNRYLELGDKYYSRHMFKQTFNIDSIGTATVLDTVVSNNIVGRSLSYDLKYPVITETTTITIREPYIPKRQLYTGLTIHGNQSSFINGASGNLLYKDRKDRMFAGSVGVINSQVNFGVSTYWKLKF